MIYTALYRNLPLVAFILIGLLLLLAGIRVNILFKPKLHSIRLLRIPEILEKLLDKISSIQPFGLIRHKIQRNTTVMIFDEKTAGKLASILALLVPVTSLVFAIILFSVGQLWYSRFMLAAMGFVLPYYLTTLLLDLYRYKMTRQIPVLVDEFRSAFIRHNKIRPALKECSQYIDRSLGRIISRTADSVFLEENLEALKLRFNNVWFNIFTILVSNFKESGGELVDQLHRLNRTITRYNTFEHKKHKRLVWYEVFSVCTAVFSIPAIFWINNLLLGETSMSIDAGTNMIVSEVIAFSLLSLVIVRILRRL